MKGVALYDRRVQCSTAEYTIGQFVTGQDTAIQCSKQQCNTLNC